MSRHKICVITCYKQPNYIRAVVLRRALQSNKNAEIFVIKNKQTSFLRYPEVIFKVFVARLKKHPNTYIVTFRGYEILPFVRLITMGKTLIFDEFVNLFEWTVREHQKIREGSLPSRLLLHFYRSQLKLTRLILSDTQIHADYSSKLMALPQNKYAVIPVGADEELFHPGSKKQPENKTFQVFYYGNMLPLHGIENVLEAAEKLSNKKNINFLIVGGKEKIREMIKISQSKGASIIYKSWIPFEELPETMSKSQLFLGGPFGDTIQSRMVITGKTYQSLAMGKATIIGKIDNLEGFSDRKNVLIVKQGSGLELEQAIRWAYNNRDKLDSIGSSGYILYKQRFSENVIKDKLYSAINRIKSG